MRTAKSKAAWTEPRRDAIGKCKACNHPKVAEINAGFALKTHKSATFQDIYDINWANATNHWNKHVPPEEKAAIYADVRASKGMKVVQDDRVDVMTTLKRLSEITEKWLERAESSDDLRGGIAAVAELRKQVALAANLLAHQPGESDVVLPSSPAWQRIKNVLMDVLNNHPAAKQEFLSKIGNLALDAKR